MVPFLQPYFCICFYFLPIQLYLFPCFILVIIVGNWWLNLSFHLLLLPLLSYVIIFPLELCYIVTVCPSLLCLASWVLDLGPQSACLRAVTWQTEHTNKNGKLWNFLLLIIKHNNTPPLKKQNKSYNFPRLLAAHSLYVLTEVINRL